MRRRRNFIALSLSETCKGSRDAWCRCRKTGLWVLMWLVGSRGGEGGDEVLLRTVVDGRGMVEEWRRNRGGP
ncbi:hypothetical protein EJ06DRAFT_346967 [Trichodelitschia bisporula]|uniref:Uncharacterized protein n=1 Tax=Trichodelitschia bisporula TaxID=703511 RepID=A0A6G1I3P8_9PEZI|nr:hypothetical protein EJ06DRAFT_346967 [Trichodelitschia bisporula]